MAITIKNDIMQQYKDALALDRQREQALVRAEQTRQAIDTPKAKVSDWQVAGETVADILGNMVVGAQKGLEGIYDFGATVVGTVGGFFDKDFQEDVKEHVAYNWTEDTTGKALREATQNSAIYNLSDRMQAVVRGVSQGVGQMLPSVAATVVTGGLGAGATLAQTAGMLTLGASAAGSSTEEAFNEGASFLEGAAYGALSGALEMATERLVGGAWEGVFGKGLADSAIKKVVSGATQNKVLQKGLKVLLDSAGEGAEEMVSEIVSPYLKRLTYDKQADSATVESVVEAGLIGALTSLAYSGAQTAVKKVAGVNTVIPSELENVATYDEALKKGWDNNDKATVEKVSQAKAETLKTISQELAKMSDDKRAKYIDKHNLGGMFNADGTLTDNYNNAYNGNIELARTYDTRYVSMGADVNVINSDIQRLTDNMVKEYAQNNNVSIEQATAESKPIQVYQGELSDKAQAARSKFNKALNALNKNSGLNTTFVITEANETFDGTLVDDERMYISADAFENDTWAETLVHEYTHLVEGSEEYAKMVDFLQSDDILVEVEIDGEVKRIPLWQKAQASVLEKGYGFEENKIKAIAEKVNAQMDITPEETKLYRAFLTEVAAHETQYLLGTESFIDKVVSTDRSFARKMIDRIINLKEAFAKGGDKATKAQLKMLRKAEKLYLDAARKAGDTHLVKYILSRSPELEEYVSDEISSRVGDGVIGENADNGRVSNAILSDSNGIIRFNLYTYHKGGRAILENNLVSKGFARADIEVALRTMDDLASFFEEVSTKYKDVADWNNAKVYYDDQGHAIYSAMVSNGDYPLNIDLSTICRKRKALTRVLNELVKRDLIGGLSLSADNIVKINEILKKNGFEVACPACFVETKRYRAESWANDFIDAWNGVIDTLNIRGVETLDFSHGKTTVSNGNVDISGLEAAVKKGAFGGRENNLIAKTILEYPELRGRLQKGDFFGTVGLDTMKKVAPDLYTRILNKAGSATPKITQEFTPYNGELGLFDKLAEKAKGVGGVRMFSFSDFTIEQVFDYMQVVADLASQKATMHTYTKVISFAKIFGKTGIKINMSMIPNVDKTVARERAGLDSEGNLIWSEYGVDYNEAVALMSEEGYSENVGTATIGISDAHIRKLLANKYTNYIIPYHKSNINPIVAKMTAIDWYTDYTSQQSTRYRNGVGENIKYSEGQTKKHPGKPTKVSKSEEFNFFESLERLGDAKAMAREYLAYCDEHGYVPKFEQFTAEENYYKLLVDFQVYDSISGRPVPQRPATLTFPDNVKTLIEEELEVQETAKAHESEAFEETLGEIVSAISDGGESIRYSLKEDSKGKKLSEGQPNQIKLTTNLNPTSDQDIRYSKKITRDMSDLERYNVLKDRVIENVPTAKELPNDVTKEIGRLRSGEKRALVKKILEEFGVFDKQYDNADIQLTFNYSRNNFRETYNKQQRRYVTFAKMFSVFDSIIENAVGIEVHNRNDIDYKYDPTLQNVYVLVSAFNDGDEIVPVKLEVKEFTDKENSLYVAIALESIKKEGVWKQGSTNGVAQDSRPSTISISDLFRKINPNEKDFTKYIPPQFFESNIQYSRKSPAPSQVGDIIKAKGNLTTDKIFTKDEVKKIIADIEERLVFEDKGMVGTVKGVNELIDRLWKGLNKAKKGEYIGVGVKIADYVISKTVMENIYGDTEVDEAREVIKTLKQYFHKVKISDRVLGEIKYHFDKSAGKVLSLWRAKEGGLAPDQIAQEIERTGYISSDNESQIFIEMVEAYNKAVETVNRKSEIALNSVLDSEEIYQLRQNIISAVLDGKNAYGKDSTLTKLKEAVYKEQENYRTAAKKIYERNYAANHLLFKVQQIRDLKNHRFVNSATPKADTFKSVMSLLSKIKYAGNLNESGTRKIFKQLNEWYTSDNAMLGYVEGSNVGATMFDAQLKADIESIANGKERVRLTVEEIKLADKIMSRLYTLMVNDSRIYRAGRWVDAESKAQDYIAIDKANTEIKKTYRFAWFGRLLEKLGKWRDMILDPASVVRYHDAYNEKGFWTETYEELRKAAQDQAIMEMNFKEPIEKFLEQHKGFLNETATREIDYRGKKIVVQNAMLLYMSFKRSNAQAGLVRNGFAVYDKDGNKIVYDFIKETTDLNEIEEIAKAQEQALYKQFTQAEKEYIALWEKAFNEDCKKAKEKTDIIRMGGSNVTDGYYVPIKRYGAKQEELGNIIYDELESLNNASFNKNTVQNSHMLLIGNLHDVGLRHINGITKYATLQIPMDNFKRLYNTDLSKFFGGENLNRGKRLGDMLDWQTNGKNGGGLEYLNDLILSMAGIRPKNDVFSSALGTIRGNTAVGVLALNPKVLFTQLSSYLASGHILSVDSLVRGAMLSGKDVDQYSDLAKLRNYDGTAYLARTLTTEFTGKFAKFKEKLMLPISKMDRLVIQRLFASCQVEIEKTQGLKLGSEDNKIEAGKLLNKLILETQQNTMMTEKSALMRSTSELAKTATMFTSDLMKNIGRWIDSIGKYFALKKRLANAKNATERATIEAEIKANNKQIRKSTATMNALAIYGSLIAMLFSHFFGTNDEDETLGEEFIGEYMSTWVGGIPILKDIYNYFSSGYEMQDFTLGSINDVFGGISDFAKGLEKYTETGESRQILNGARKLAFSTANAFGLPLKNLYKMTYGGINILSQSTAYKIDDTFYKQPYSKDLAKALAKDDDIMISTITELMLQDKNGGNFSDGAREEINRLVNELNDTSFLPRSLNQSFSFNKEQYTLTSKEFKQAKSEYIKANQKIDDLIAKSGYKTATDEEKATMIKFIYDYYYEQTIVEAIGADKSKTLLFASGINLEDMAIIVGKARVLEADKDRNGNTIAGSKKKKVVAMLERQRLTADQKYLMLAYLGYSTDMDRVERYVNRLRLTRDEKKSLLEECA